MPEFRASSWKTPNFWKNDSSVELLLLRNSRWFDSYPNEPVVSPSWGYCTVARVSHAVIHDAHKVLYQYRALHVYSALMLVTSTIQYHRTVLTENSSWPSPHSGRVLLKKLAVTTLRKRTHQHLLRRLQSAAGIGLATVAIVFCWHVVYTRTRLVRSILCTEWNIHRQTVLKRLRGDTSFGLTAARNIYSNCRSKKHPFIVQ